MTVCDLATQLEAWRGLGRKAALATVVQVERSAPLAPGAAMAISDRDEIIGSVSGGCIEGAVAEGLRDVMATGLARLETYGISDDDAFAVGLSCGGTVHLLLEPLDWDAPWYGEMLTVQVSATPFAIAAVLGGAGLGRRLLVTERDAVGGTGDAALDRRLTEAARAAIFAPPGQRDAVLSNLGDAFLEVHAQPPTAYIFGFVEFASSLAHLARFLGYRVVVADPRSAFLTPQRFPDADELVHRWPHELLAERRVWPMDAICVLSHDPKIDVPAIRAALSTSAGYICALGGRKTRERRSRLLREAGVSDAELARVFAPAGLDLGGSTAAETALSIAAEMVATLHGHAGGRLASKGAGIHAGGNRAQG